MVSGLRSPVSGGLQSTPVNEGKNLRTVDRRPETGDRPRAALITGASSGIGAAFAEVFAARGFDLIVTARREDRLRALAASLEERYRRQVIVIPADLAQTHAPAALCDEIAARGLVVDALVNNAGFGVPGSYAGSAWDRQSQLLQVLVTAVAELTHRLLPGMIQRRYGRVINVASLAGLLPAPAGHTLYPAAKAFVIRFSEALAEEVRRHGVNVTAVCPGFTFSEFHDVTDTRHLVDKLPAFMWLDAATVAEKGYEAVMQGRPVYVTGRVNRGIAAVGRHAPRVFDAFQRRFSWSFRKT
jgi:short-subunit dehydrogenase